MGVRVQVSDVFGVVGGLFGSLLVYVVPGYMLISLARPRLSASPTDLPPACPVGRAQLSATAMPLAADSRRAGAFVGRLGRRAQRLLGGGAASFGLFVAVVCTASLFVRPQRAE
jgi:hypothetical protein